MVGKSFNDRMVARTVLPVIYVWITASSAVVYTGIMNQDSEDSITDTLMAFEIENSAILENWDGDLSKMDGSIKYLENLFADIDKEKN